jgi:membrane protein implicated in regulation of membrane protease activity
VAVLLWLVGGVVLAIAELFTMDLILIMLAGGAFAAAGTAALGGGIALQALVFALVSALGLAAARPALKRHLEKRSDHTRMGVEALEGAEATVVEQVTSGGGMVKIGGELWTARAYDATQVIEAGTHVRVVEVKGATALVWKE